ncbi:hypothetical protein B0H14DRAFT_2621764 [Mycena olivaceomarginata]|nr:hypothetical protein B0H14DRAFT_2621764 [Mycena olivaceomarginata]
MTANSDNNRTDASNGDKCPLAWFKGKNWVNSAELQVQELEEAERKLALAWRRGNGRKEADSLVLVQRLQAFKDETKCQIREARGVADCAQTLRLLIEQGKAMDHEKAETVELLGRGELPDADDVPDEELKLKFFESRKDDYVTVSETKVAGSFYTKMTKLYIVKYGYELSDDKDFAVDVVDPPDWVANKVVNEKLVPEEEKFRQEFHTKFTWANGIAHNTPAFSKRTRQPSRYEEHIKLRVEARKRVLAKRAELSGVKAPHAITVQNEVTKECWEEETYVYQQEMVQERKREHDIHPFINTIAERFGMCVSILMVGPIGKRGSRIEMQSVHSGKTRGVVEKDWPLHDPEGFTRVQSSMVEFGHHVFSRTECEARVTLVQEPEELVGPGPATSSSLSTAAATSSTAAGAQSTVAGSHAGSAAAAAAAGVSARQRQATGGGAQAGNDGGVGPETNEGEGSSGRNENPEDTTSAQAGNDGGVSPEPNEGKGSGGGDENAEDTTSAQVEKLWKWQDAAKWTGGIDSHTHRLRMRKDTRVGQITMEDRPDALDWWILRGRKWEKKVDIGVLGDAKTPRTFVSKWWSWWVKGERVADGSPADAWEWLSAVEDVAETFREMLRPGVIAKFKKATERGGTDAAKGKKRKAAEGNDNNEGSHQSTHGNSDVDRPMKRLWKGRGN